MNRKFRLFAIPAAAAVAAATATGVLTTASSASTAASGTTTIHVRELNQHVTYVPIGQLTGSKAQQNQGDYLAFDDPLVNPTNYKHKWGNIEGTCTLVYVSSQNYYCSVNFIFPHGTLSADGTALGTGKVTVVPINGGTGAYQGAHGTARVQLGNTTNDFVLTFTN